MSGLEVIGVAASIIQVADLGTKLSVRLFSLYRRFKDADQSLRDLSNDVALTCAILRELGESIEKDEQSKLCSEEAFCTLKSILSQCREVLEQIQNMIDYRNNSQKTPLQRMTEKIRNVLMEPSLDPLKSNLERLKSTMLLLLNVIMYAGQIRSKHVPTLLQEQRALLESLLEERRSDGSLPVDQKGELLVGLPEERGSDRSAFIGLSQVTGPESTSSKMHAQSDGESNTVDGRDEPKQYNVLIQRMLQEIDLCKSKLESSRHSRIKDGVLNIHSGEIVRFQLEYGYTILQKFDHSVFAGRNIRPPELKRSAKSSPASTMPQPQYPDNDAPQKPAIDRHHELCTLTEPGSGLGQKLSSAEKPPDERLRCGRTGPSSPAVSPDDTPHQSIQDSNFVLHENETKEQVTSNPQPNEHPPDSLSTMDHNLATDGRENSTSVPRDPDRGYNFVSVDPSAPGEKADSRSLIRANAGRYIWEQRRQTTAPKARSKKLAGSHLELPTRKHRSQHTVDVEIKIPPKLHGDKSCKPKAKSKAACPSTPESTSLNDDSLPDNLVDLILRWTNIQRDELEGHSQKRHRDSKGQEAPSEKNHVSEEFTYKPEDTTTVTAVPDQDSPNISGQT